MLLIDSSNLRKHVSTCLTADPPDICAFTTSVTADPREDLCLHPTIPRHSQLVCTSGFQNATSLKPLRLTCRLLDEEVLAV